MIEKRLMPSSSKYQPLTLSPIPNNLVYIANIRLRNLAQTPRENSIFFSEFLNFSVVFESQIPTLHSVMFAVNTTTRAASNLDYLQFCSSQPLLSPGTVHQKFE